MREGFSFEPEHPPPIANAVELFVRGVCQVRHNYFHGEKFRGGAEPIARDHALISEARWVLGFAAARHPEVGDRLRNAAAEAAR